MSLAKKMGNPNFFEIVPHLHTAPRAFFESRSPNILISIEIELLVLDMQCWYIYYLESYIRVTLNFLVFCNLLKKQKTLSF